MRLDQVLVTLGHLYRTFYKLNQPQDEGLRTALLASIEKRWNASDQDVFIAAALLNPYVHTGPFNNLQVCTLAGMVDLFERLYKRFYPHIQAEPYSMYRDVECWVGRTGPYVLFETTAKRMKGAAEVEVRCSPSRLNKY